MKVKEVLSKEFNGDENMDFFKDKEQKYLKEKDGIVLLEQIYRVNDLPYSHYGLYDNNGNVMYINIMIPDPRKGDEYKDIFLKYQHGVRTFMSNFFDVFVGEKEDFNQMYTTKQKKELIYEKSDDKVGSTLLHLASDKDYLFGIISFDSSQMNLDVAENFIKYFEGIPIEKKWKDICVE